MTVRGLIDILERLDPEVHVFTRGYEGGYEDAELRGAPFDVVLNVNPKESWWYGPHQSLSTYKTDLKGRTIVKGVVL
jgi:hypothetical protein